MGQRHVAGDAIITVDVGDHTLWLIHGPRAYLACAIRGVPPVGLRDELARVVEEIHRRHAGLLQDFDGDPASATALIPLMEPCLQMETAAPRDKRFPWPVLLLALAAGRLEERVAPAATALPSVAPSRSATLSETSSSASSSRAVPPSSWEPADMAEPADMELKGNLQLAASGSLDMTHLELKP